MRTTHPGPPVGPGTVVEPDLASWAWHRATGAAVAVVVAASAGLLLTPGELGGAVLTGGAAAAAIYVVGPCLALLERYRLRDEVVTLGRLRRFWLVAAAASACLPLLGAWGALVAAVGAPLALLTAWVAVPAGLRLPAVVGRPLAVLVPIAVVAAGVVAAARPTLVDGALMAAVLVVVPVAVPLLPRVPPPATLVVLAAGTPAAAGLLLRPEDGLLASALTVPWVVLTAIGALAAVLRWQRAGWGRRDLPPVVACGYLAVGALWLLADRLAVEPAGFGPPFVQLTAVHFTYAGFVATVMATRARTVRPTDRIAGAAVACTVAAPPLVALGFVTVGALQIVGAVVLTVGTYALAWVTLRHVVPRSDTATSSLLAISSVSVLVPMALAVQWAVGTNLGTPALSIPAMTATHGVTNALGFCLLGVLGWRREARDRPATAADGTA